jgi:hypothetical protein
MYLGGILLFTACLACLESTGVSVSDSCLADQVNCTLILLDTDDNLIISCVKNANLVPPLSGTFSDESDVSVAVNDVPQFHAKFR